MSADKDNSFITEHFALVHSIAGRFRNRGIEYDELFSAGCVGLVKAGNNFDESRGAEVFNVCGTGHYGGNKTAFP